MQRIVRVYKDICVRVYEGMCGNMRACEDMQVHARGCKDVQGYASACEGVLGHSSACEGVALRVTMHESMRGCVRVCEGT